MQRGFAAGICAAIVLVGLAAACRSSTANTSRYVDRNGWSLRYPHGLHIERSTYNGRVYVTELTVANFQPRRAVRSGHDATSGWMRVDSPLTAKGAFPKDGIAFRIASFDGGPGPDLMNARN